ncbi:MAG TPA: alanine racemase [Polyangiaceae bacterium]|nr:alanine racemase [Polyangiaceae bacterium]
MGLGYGEMRAALEGQSLPIAFVDLDAFDRNLARHVAITKPRGTPLRVATKSVRVVALLRRLLEREPDALRGLMCYSLAEAAFLVQRGFDDLLVAYPPYRDLALAAELNRSRSVSVVVDCEAQVARLDSLGVAEGVRIPAVICLDMSFDLFGQRVGVRRSPLREPSQVVALARRIAEGRGVRFLGLLAYEAQIAGVGDASPFERALNPVKRWIKRASVSDVAMRRTAIVHALRDAGLDPALVNGGGTGSLDTTTPDSGVTEVTAGSGFFKPHLFDYYSNTHMRRLEPAAFFALEVTRLPSPSLVTCLGGGYVASGSAGRDKVPLPYLPRGLELLPMEMCGEVQTPLRVPAGVSLALGDPVVFRHAKAGELCERFERVALISEGRIVDCVPTYRGEGACFL